MFIAFDSIAQTCECTDCPIPIIDNTITSSCLDVSGLTNPTLGVAGQGVCGIEIQFEHSWLTEVSITLIAPNGSSVVLVPNTGSGPTPNSTWDIDFITCADIGNPDPGFPVIFSPDGYGNGAYIGTYFPGGGCFEDLTGDANGTWKLEVEDYFIVDEGEVTTWSIIFCDGTGTDCGPPASCEAEAGFYSVFDQYLCVGGPDFIMAPDVSGQTELPAYGYTFIINNATTPPLSVPSDIIEYSDNADFTGYDVGIYWVCGLSYLLADEALLPTPDGTLTIDDIQDDIDNGLYCADIAGGCMAVVIQGYPEVPIVTAPDTLCDQQIGQLIWYNYVPNDFTWQWEIDTYGSIWNFNFSVFPTTLDYSGTGETDSVMICVIHESVCGNQETCIVTVILEPPSPFIVGEMLPCYGAGSGNTYEYTLSDPYLILNYNWYINPTEDSYIIGDNTGPSVTVGFPDDPENFSGEICLVYDSYCENNVTICLDITPNDIIIGEDFTPDVFCGLSGAFDIEANGTGTGYWVQDSGPGTSIFGDDTELNTTVNVSDAGMYSFTFTTDCGDMITVDIEFFESTGEPSIDGIFIACPGELLTFSVIDLDPNVLLDWTSSGDATIQGASDQNSVDILLADPSTGAITEICLNYQDPCDAMNMICEVINFTAEDLVDLSEQSFCSLDFTLDVQVNGTDGAGQWTLISGPGTPVFDNELNSVTSVTVDAYGDYIFEFSGALCGTTIQVPITTYENLGFDNLLVECVGADFIVSFDIIGGEQPYLVDGVEISGSSFASGLVSGTSYSFTVSDYSICIDLVVSGNVNCDCESEAGSINPQELLVSCENEVVSIFLNGDTYLDPNDGAVFILYTDLLDPFGTIAFESSIGEFSFIPPLQYGVLYYVAYVVGDELAGSVDFSDPCIDVATGASVIFSEPFELSEILFSEIAGCDIVLGLSALQTTSMIGEWSVVSAPDGSSVMFDGISGITTIATFSDTGTYIIQYTLDNGFCSDTEEITLELTESNELSVVNISYICDVNSENYQVNFEIIGGELPYIINGTMISSSTFISGPIPSGDIEMFAIEDANGCEPVLFTSDYTCIDNCVSYAELLLIDLVELCEDETYTVVESGNSILEGDDIGVYVLHTNAGNVLGTILGTNTTGEFSFNPFLDYNVVYYISFVVGNEIAGEVDFTDECLSVTLGQSIVFHEFPSANLDFETLVCSYSFEITSDIIVGDSSNWSTLSSPVGSMVEYTNISASNVSISVDRVGAYSFIFFLSNGTCVTYDTVSIEVQDQSSVVVMDDFSTCDLMFDIYALSIGSPQSWDVIGTQNYSIDNNESDSTIITFESSGIYEIVRNVGTGVCAASDTFTVEIFEESTFTVTDILCDENNETYTVSYTLEGSSYPYNINGQIINLGESADLSADSEEPLIIYVEDANMCEIFADTLVYSCDCQSDPGVMDSNLIEACEDESIVVIPSQGGVVIEFDSLVYVLHTSSSLMITNILSVSDIGEFSFDPLLMSFNTVYYVSAVVFSGSTFDIDVLDDVCTKTSIGTPVIWINNNQIVLPGTLTFCEFDEVEISLLYSGFVPATIRLTDESGNEYNLMINQEGESNFKLDLDESSIMVVDQISANSCATEVVGGLEIKIVELPFVGFIPDVTVCNTSAYGSTIPLNDLISTSNTEGIWYDYNDNIVSGVIDFDGISEGDYIYRFVTTGNEPCDEVSYSVHIFVEDCDCPMDIFLSFDGLCQGEYDLELDDYLKPEFIGLGTWSILILEGTNAIPLIGSELFIDDINIGRYQLIYMFDELPQNCQQEYTFEFEILGNLSSGIGPLMPIEFCIDDLFEIILFDYLSEYDEGGEWTSQNGLTINVLTGLVDLTMVDGGLYTFDYTIPADEYCPPASTEVLILIHDPLELFLSILDPICFGENDGSVTATDINGTPILFNLFNNNQEIISNPDSLFAGEYELTTVDENGCVILENFSLLDPLELFLDLGDDRIVEEGEITTITPVLNLTEGEISLYQWFINQANLDIPTFDTLLISPDGETNIQLIITDDDGCIVADDLLLTLINNNTPPILANIFNPLTSTFGIEPFAEIESVKRFSIFDRWGSLIFNETNFVPTDRTKQWDGTFEGTIVSNGVYVYIIEYINPEGKTISIFGDVAIIR